MARNGLVERAVGSPAQRARCLLIDDVVDAADRLDLA
jgi:hypothetical protein